MRVDPLRHVSRGLVILLLIAAGLESMRVFYGTPVLASEVTVGRNSDQQDFKRMTEQAEKLESQGMYVAAAEIWQKLLAGTEKNIGQDHANTSLILNNLGVLMRKQGKYDEAEYLYRKALIVNEKTFGETNLNIAISLNNLAGIKYLQGQYDEAARFARRALNIRENALGSKHPDVALSLGRLAQIVEAQGEYPLAEELHRRSLSIFEKELGPNHDYVAVSLNNLAWLLSNQGFYSAAEPIYRRSLSIYEKELGPNHPDVATSLHNLGMLLVKEGQYSKAELIYRRSLDIREKVFGEEHPDFAFSLNDLAVLMRLQGKYSAGEALSRRSLAIKQRIFGTDHLHIASSLNNLALLLEDQELVEEARLLHRRSLDIFEKALGPEHPNVAASLNNLATLLGNEGNHAEAELLLRRALSIYKKALGLEHPDVAASLNNLAASLGDEGKYVEAELLQRRALAIYEKVLGPEHPNLATGLGNLAGFLKDQGQHDNAVSVINRSLSVETSWLISELPLLPEQFRAAQLRQLGGRWEFPFAWIDHHPPSAELALKTRLNRQGLILEIEQRQGLLLNSPGVDQAKVEQLQALTQQLASVSLPPERRAAARDQRDRLQSELYRQIPELQIQLVTPLEVAKALPADGVLVEFQRYRPWDGRKPKHQRWGEAQYIALVLKPSGSISSVPLGPAAAIEATVHKGLRASAEGLTDAEAVWAQLSNQVLKPLLPQLGGSRQWFLSPDGELNRVPFAALPAPQQLGTPLAKVVQLRLLTTGRELVRLQQPAPPSTAALVMANPSYDRANARPAQATRPDTDSNGAQRRSAELGSSRWTPLPATQREGQQVASLLGSGLISGAAATTTNLQRQKGPALLHIASHGFFVADSEKEPAKPFLALQDQSTLLQPLRGEDPQLRSGLVFAGANQPDADPNDDGYLTAAEAVNLNLKGTQLVVLSACSTGQGDVRTGEGVYGLQRSLTVAGARSTLLSLWKVDDAATAEFMSRFYKRLKAGEGRADALAAVQSEFRSGAVRGPSGEDWSPPYYWAAWQLVGDWRPIQEL